MNYRAFTDNHPFEKIIIRQVSQFNPSIQNLELLELDNLSPNDYIICGVADSDSSHVIGQFSLCERNITESKYYPALKRNSISYGCPDPTKIFRKSRCVQIDNCILGEPLNNLDSLRQLFSQIVSVCDREIKFIWMDDNDLVYYPLTDDLNRISAIFYFSDKMLNNH